MADTPVPTVDLSTVSTTLQGFTGLMTVVTIISVIAAIFVLTSVLASNIVEYWSARRGIRGALLYDRLNTALPALMSDPIIRSLTPTGGAPSPKNFPSYIDPATFANAVQATYIAPPVASTLITNLQQPAGSFATNLTNWFKDVGDRLSGSYARWTFWYLIVAGLALAAGMDLDVYSIVDSIANPPAAVSTPALSAAVKALKAADASKPDDVKEAKKDFVDAWDASLKVPLPKPAYAWQVFPKTFGGWLSKVGSWVAAAFATSLGAQFWFNILTEALKIRGSGPKP